MNCFLFKMPRLDRFKLKMEGREVGWRGLGIRATKPVCERCDVGGGLSILLRHKTDNFLFQPLQKQNASPDYPSIIHFRIICIRSKNVATQRRF